MGQASKGLNPAYILIFILCGISKVPTLWKVTQNVITESFVSHVEVWILT